MKILDAITKELNTMNTSDLLLFFKKDEIDKIHRDKLLELNIDLKLQRNDFEIKSVNEYWSLFSTPHAKNEGLFLYSHNEQIIFVNHSFISDLLIELLSKTSNQKELLPIKGLQNNSKIEKIGHVSIESSYSLSQYIHEKIYGEVIDSFNQLNQERLLLEEEEKFNELPILKQRQFLKKIKEGALNRFLSNTPPPSFRFELQTGSQFNVNGLNIESIESMFESLENREHLALVAELDANVDEDSLTQQYKRFLEYQYYTEHLNEWSINPVYSAAKELSRLKQQGYLHGREKTLIDTIEVKLILKGKNHKPINGWIQYPKQASFYFHSTNGHIPFTEVSKVFVDNREIFCFESFKEQLFLQNELDKALELEKENTLVNLEHEGAFSEALVEAVENISQKSALVGGQMALNLF